MADQHAKPVAAIKGLDCLWILKVNAERGFLFAEECHLAKMQVAARLSREGVWRSATRPFSLAGGSMPRPEGGFQNPGVGSSSADSRQAQGSC